MKTATIEYFPADGPMQAGYLVQTTHELLHGGYTCGSAVYSDFWNALKYIRWFMETPQ